MSLREHLSKFTEKITAAPENITFYVSPDGREGACGEKNDPFRTLGEACEQINRLIDSGAEGEFTVGVLPGEYRSNGIELSIKRSGGKARVTFLALERESARTVISGGTTIKGSDFQPAQGELAARFTPEARKHIYSVRLADVGIDTAELGKICAVGTYNTAHKYDGGAVGTNCELFFNDRRMRLARYPNGNDFLKLEAVASIGEVHEFPPQNYYREFDSMRNPDAGCYIMRAADNERVKTWQELDDIWAFGYFYWDWADASTPIKKFDTEHRRFFPEYTACFGARAGAPYYFYNIPEELDEPGEWYLDRKNGVLYIYPYGDMTDAEIDISLYDGNVINADADDLTLDGFMIKCSRGSGIIMRGDRNTLRNCEIKNVYGSAAELYGNDNLISACEAAHTGRGGFMVCGGDRSTLTAGNNAIDNCYIHDFGEVYLTYSLGASLQGVGNRCTHNEICFCPSIAVGYGGNEHLIEYNYIHDVVRQSSDSGAIYSGYDWTAHGTVIRYNVIADVGGGEHRPDGIYYDDSLSGQTAYGNLLVNVMKNGFLIGGGRDIRVNGNIIAGCGTPISYDDRARDGFVNGGWAKQSCNSPDSPLWTRLHAVKFREKPWSEKYPSLAEVIEDFDQYDDPRFPPNPANSDVSGNVILKLDRGDCVRCADSVCRYSRIANNPVYTSGTEAGFIDAENGDYSLRPDAKLFSVLPDFEPIPLEKIGRY